MLLRLVLAVAIAVVATHESDGDVFIVHFRRKLTPSFVRRIDQTLGYQCVEYVHPDGLLLYLTNATMTQLRAHYSASLHSIERVDEMERCSPSLTTYRDDRASALAGQTTLNRVLMNGSIVSPTSEDDGGGALYGTLRVLLHNGAFSVSPASAWHTLVRDAIETLDESYQVVVVSSQSPELVHIDNVLIDEFSAVAALLIATVSCVCYVEPVHAVQLVNLWSSSTAQLPSAISHSNINVADACSDATCRPLWAAGVRGSGQLVAVSDTGMTTSACHFYDASGASVPVSSSSSVIPADSGHRTVRSYWTGSGGDALDADGHGSHVVGILLGSADPVNAPADSPSALDARDFDGVAPDARIVMIDAQSGSGGLSIPSPYDTELLRYAYDAGARIHSGSWGIGDWVYSDEDRRVDSFCWTHRSFLAVFAAGNSGGDRGPASILSPALAKNALAVGAAMNGFSANDVASGSTPSSPVDAYAFDWLADFSSRGGAAMTVPWLKPDVVGAGGRYVWSASSTSPSSCSNVASTVIGLAGTSMAAPHVAGAAALMRQYFMDTSLNAYSPTQFEPMASLLKCLLASSSTPLRGIFPQIGWPLLPLATTYAPYGRGYFEGHGHIGIARVLPLAPTNATAMLVLANEAQRAMSRSNQVHRYCVAIEPASPSSPVAIVVALAYTDYPSGVVSTPALVNDLDLRVYVDDALVLSAHPNGLTTRDGRSPLEVVHVATTTGRVRVEVWSHAINFDIQSYSLSIVALQPSTRIRVNGKTSASPDDIEYDETLAGSCVECAAGTTYVHECIECGNGRVEGAEECDSATQPCCDAATCTLYTDNRDCVAPIVEDTCFVHGTCDGSSAECSLTAQSVGLSSLVYTLDVATGDCSTPTTTTTTTTTAAATTTSTSSGATTIASPSTTTTTTTTAPTITTMPPPTPSPTAAVCSRSVDSIMHALPGAYVHGADAVCCRTFADIRDHYLDGSGGALDPQFERLARQLVAAIVNFRRGVPATAPQLFRIDEAQTLLESHCNAGFALPTASSVRRAAHELVDMLDEYNEGTCVGDDIIERPVQTCVAEQARASALYCEAAGTYDFTNDVCQCDASHHSSEVTCDALHCSAHGASARDDNGALRCACLPGWSGTQCSSCDLNPPELRELQYLCIGLDAQRVPIHYAHYTHVLMLVASDTVAARLSGSYYQSGGGGQTKPADLTPGTGSHDCWCLTSATSITPGDYASHADALNAATDYWTLRDALYALAAPFLQSGSTIVDPPAPPGATPPSPTPNSGARLDARAVSTTALALLLWVCATRALGE